VALILAEECRYTVFKLSAGAYFKYSSGGTPVLLFALGYGTEGKNDVGETYDFVLGDEKALPAAATLGMVGMRVGGPPLHPSFSTVQIWHCGAHACTTWLGCASLFPADSFSSKPAGCSTRL
jgi:hypothetical protein